MAFFWGEGVGGGARGGGGGGGPGGGEGGVVFVFGRRRFERRSFHLSGGGVEVVMTTWASSHISSSVFCQFGFPFGRIGLSFSFPFPFPFAF